LVDFNDELQCLGDQLLQFFFMTFEVVGVREARTDVSAPEKGRLKISSFCQDFS
jgi:hypothetical protein